MAPVQKKAQDNKKSVKAGNTPKVKKEPKVKNTVAEVVEAGDVDEVVQVSPLEAYEAVYGEMNDNLTNIVAQVKTLLVQQKALRNLHNKVVKTLNKKNKKRKDSDKKKNGTFELPWTVSPELAEFLGGEPTDVYLRPQVTQMIGEYVKKNNLYIEGKKHNYFNPDNKLKAILGEARFPYNKNVENSEICYAFQNLQTYLAPHYGEIVPQTPVTEVVSA